MMRYPMMPEKAMVPMTLATRMIWNERMRNTCMPCTQRSTAVPPVQLHISTGAHIVRAMGPCADVDLQYRCSYSRWDDVDDL